jgi:ketosteroid isomerase-like protein
MRFLLVLVFIGAACFAQTGRNAAGLAQSERNFSAASDSFGVNASFLRFLSDECVMFNPNPVNGKEIYRNRKENGIHLTWHPTFVEVAHSGDFGISSGPWEIRASKIDTPVSYGHYFSIWEVQKNGAWKLVLDNGIRYPKESRRKDDFHLRDLPKERSPDRMDTNSIRTMEDDFIRDMKNIGAAAAYRKYAAENILVYRQGEYPVRRKDAALKILKNQPVPSRSWPYKVNGASSGDLAFTYGVSVDAYGDSSSFVRVWRNDGGWKIAVDMLERFR